LTIRRSDWPHRCCSVTKLSPRGRRDDMPSADASSTRDGFTSVRGRVRSPHTSGGRRWLSCRQPACLQPRAAAPWDRQTDGRIAVSLNAPPLRWGHNSGQYIGRNQSVPKCDPNSNCTHLILGSLGLRVRTLNGISIGLAVFAEFTNVSNGETHRQYTEHR